MEAENFKSLRQAADYAKVTRQTILDWCTAHEIGEKNEETGNWVISRKRLDGVITARNFLRRGVK